MRTPFERQDHVAGRVDSAIYIVGTEKWRYNIPRRRQGALGKETREAPPLKNYLANCSGPTFRQIGPWEHGAVFADEETSPENGPITKSRGKTKNEIGERLPKLLREQPGLGLESKYLTRNDQLSTAIESTDDATVGDLLAVGAVADKRQHRKVGIFASVAGPDRRSLRLSWAGRSFSARNSPPPGRITSHT